jgi:hypothetical protein
MCCFNRPYDDQTQARIHLETEAKLLLQQKVKNAECDLIWSSVTTDDRLIKKMRNIGTLPTMLPGEAIAFVENWYEN